MRAARAELESLLRARKLDVTVPSPSEPDRDAVRTVPTGWAAVDEPLGGGVPRGHLSEIVGVRSSGRTALFCALAAAATSRGEAVALVDTHDRFDPASAAAAGVDLRRLLWIRDSGDADRALKATMLVLQAGGFAVVALDLADAPLPVVRRFPHTTWMRLARTIEGSLTAVVVLAAEHIARSAGGCTIALDAAAAEWDGAAARSRRLRGLALRPRIVAPHRRVVSREL